MDDLPTTPAEIMDLASSALLPIGNGGVELAGSVRIFDTAGRFRFTVDASGRFRRELHGPIEEIVVFDGAVVRQLDDAGIPFVQELFLREYYLAEALVLSGLWAEPGRRFQVASSRVADDDRNRVLVLQLSGGRLSGELVVSAKTGVPISWRVQSIKGSAGIEFREFAKQDGGRLVPRAFRVRSPDGYAYDVSIEEVRTNANMDFQLPPRKSGFDSSIPGKVEMMVSRSGHLFIKPRLNGNEAGWFAFDTGAAVTMVSKDLAEKAAPEIVGTRNLVGGGAGVLTVTLRRMARFEAGPLRIENLLCIESSDELFAQFTGLLGEPVVGIVGWDILIRAVAELDLVEGALTLHDPSAYRLKTGEWETLALHLKHPFFRAKMEGNREGWFCVDSGAGQIPVMIHSGAVQRWDLLRDRETEEGKAGGVAGEFRFRAGTLEWFEVAGRRFENPIALFIEGEAGALSDEYSDGTLGLPFFEHIILILDYSRSRIAFQEKQ